MISLQHSTPLLVWSWLLWLSSAGAEACMPAFLNFHTAINSHLEKVPSSAFSLLLVLCISLLQIGMLVYKISTADSLEKRSIPVAFCVSMSKLSNSTIWDTEVTLSEACSLIICTLADTLLGPLVTSHGRSRSRSGNWNICQGVTNTLQLQHTHRALQSRDKCLCSATARNLSSSSLRRLAVLLFWAAEMRDGNINTGEYSVEKTLFLLTRIW